MDRRRKSKIFGKSQKLWTGIEGCCPTNSCMYTNIDMLVVDTNNFSARNGYCWQGQINLHIMFLSVNPTRTIHFVVIVILSKFTQEICNLGNTINSKKEEHLAPYYTQILEKSHIIAGISCWCSYSYVGGK